MSVVYGSGNSRRGSAWQEEAASNADEEVRLVHPYSEAGRVDIPDGRLYAMEVSLREQQLLLRLRMLEAGEFMVVVRKDQRGMIGLREWLVDGV